MLNQKMSSIKNLKILIVEDDEYQLLKLEKTLHELQYKNIYSCISFKDAADQLEKNHFDLVISDFYLDLGKTAIDLLLINLNNDNAPFLIRSIEYSDKVLDQIINYTNVDFQSKDATNYDIEKAIRLLRNKNSSQPKKKISEIFFVKQNQGFTKVQISSIEVVKVDGKYLDIYTVGNEKYTVRSSLNTFLDRLPDFIIKIRQNIAVNINYIKTVNLEEMTVYTSNQNNSISRSFRSDFLGKYVIK